MKKSDLIDGLVHRPATTLGRLAGYHDLTELHDQWITQTWDEPGPVGMMAFRGSFKTSAVVIIGIIRHLMLHPESRVLLVRKTFTDASETLGAISAIFAKPEIQDVFAMLWGECKIVEDTQKRFTLSTKPVEKKEASINAFGIGDSITGTHADVIITDDILNISDRVSEAARKQTLNAFYELQNIIDPSREGGTPPKQIFNGTRWHEKDVWTAIEKIAKIYEYKASDYWAGLFPAAALEEKRKAMAPAIFAINYELSFIADETLLFQNPRYGNRIGPENKAPVYAHVDAAYGGNDTTALTLIQGNIVLGKLWRDTVLNHLDAIKALWVKYNVKCGWLETNADKGLLADKLRSMGMDWKRYSENQNKDIKIASVIYPEWPNLEFDPDTDGEYIEQIMDWHEKTTGNDDAPDSLAGILQKSRKQTIKKVSASVVIEG